MSHAPRFHELLSVSKLRSIPKKSDFVKKKSKLTKFKAEKALKPLSFAHEKDFMHVKKAKQAEKECSFNSP